MAKKTLNVSDFFSTTREREGIWYEAKVDGIPTGIEFKLLGFASDKSVLAADQYVKDKADIEKETDPVKRAEMDRIALTKRILAVVTDVRCKDPEMELTGPDGKPFVYSEKAVYDFIYESGKIRADLAVTTTDSTNFMMKKA